MSDIKNVSCQALKVLVVNGKAPWTSSKPVLTWKLCRYDVEL